MPKKKAKMPSESDRAKRIEENWDKMTKKQRNRYFKQTDTKSRIVPMVKGKLKGV